MMVEWLEFLRCPRTAMKLKFDDCGNLVTENGQYHYPVLFGIPDFRVFDPPYINREKEIAIIEKLDEKFNELSYEELVEYLESKLLGERRIEFIRKGITHRLKLRKRSPDRLQDLLCKVNNIKPFGKVLDLGCGSGEAIKALNSLGGESIVGMDISMIELILAKKLLIEENSTALLLAGCAESMPFSDGYFDFVYSPDVIEHVSDQNKYLGDINRILNKRGVVVLNSPNRYSLVSPEPHVGIWLLTYLPRPVISPVCRLMGKGEYIGKKLLSLRELNKIIATYFNEYKILARSANSKSESFLGKIYYLLSPWSEKIFAYVTDQHVVIAIK